LPDDVHWFCPRSADDDGHYYEEDLQDRSKDDPSVEKTRVEKVEAATKRKNLALDSMQILAFDGSDAVVWQNWLKGRMDAFLTRCDICIRVYHRGRRELKHLLEEYIDRPERFKSCVLTGAGNTTKMRLQTFCR
jgi:senataxin